MDRYLVDTSVLIDVTNGREPAQSRVRALIDAGEEVEISAVTVAEFCSGVPPQDLADSLTYLRTFRFWEVTWEIATRAGTFRERYARLSQSISTTDALIAANAVEIGAVLVTNNVRYFPMPELRLLRPEVT